MAVPEYPDYPPDLNEQQQEYLLTNLKDWSIAHGLAVRTPENPSGPQAITAPVTLFPSLFPRVCFEQARSVAQAYNELYSAIASDEEWLGSVVEELTEIDDFMAELWKVHLAVKREGYVQPLNLGLFRSDYMVHIDPSDAIMPLSVKQVEFNTIASSFGGLSSQVSAMHNHLLRKLAYPDSTSLIKDSSLQQSSSAHDLAKGLSAAHRAYGASGTGHPTCVLFLVQANERNVFDQKHVELALIESHGVEVFRLTFDRVLENTAIDNNRKLIYTPPHAPHQHFEVSLVYFRAGYAPTEYDGVKAWEARHHIERSAAIKCPSVLLQLAGTKKVQQVLATPHSPHLKHFLSDPAQSEQVLKTFAPIYPLDQSEAGQEARKLATSSETAAKYVLKPQREGGGNNVYRKNIPGFLKGLPESHWPAHILMEMIEPPAQQNVIYRNGELQKGGVICELGVYGVCLWKNGSNNAERAVKENFEAGYLLRTKGDSSEEGGVAAGFGCVDSVCLVDV
ncbi:Eukaryotic glutathione synthase [Teratosphaeria destructans]|uniref:Glutathione synthetase n=1 Tax=Teratosphaeria destructans TaxID=418781 RepID=A0A9W7SIY9_9PEZI|nr:Eukaryotic glutathione synthase [Teratosphaeria destructans]